MKAEAEKCIFVTRFWIEEIWQIPWNTVFRNIFGLFWVIYSYTWMKFSDAPCDCYCPTEPCFCYVLLDAWLELPISTKLVVHQIQHLVWQRYASHIFFCIYSKLSEGYIFELILHYPHTLPWIHRKRNGMYRQLLIRDGLGWQLVSWPLPPTRLLLFSPSFAVLSG